MAEDYTITNPVDHTKIGDLPGEIRNVKTLVVSGAGRHFSQATAPATRYEGTAFSADDVGVSIWHDSDDNKLYLLTATTPTWTLISTEIIATLLAAARIFAFADATLTLQNTDEENTDGGRQSSLRFKGEQDGTEVTTLATIEASHDGAADDQKGQLKVSVNDGDDDDTPSKVAVTISSDGKLVIAESLIALDEDNMATDSAVQLATQQSIKKYVDDQLAFSAYTNEDSDSTAMLKSHAYKAATDGFVQWECVPGPGQNVVGYVGLTDDPPNAGDRVAYSIDADTYATSGSFPVAKDEYFEFTTDGAAAVVIRWKSRGALSKPVDQEA